MTQEQRAKVLKKFPAGAQTELTTLNTLLNEKVSKPDLLPLPPGPYAPTLTTREDP